MVFAVCAALIGCGVPQQRTWAVTSMADADVMPTVFIAQRPVRAVVLAPDEPADAPPGTGWAATATASLESVLSSNGIVLVDRALAARLERDLHRPTTAQPPSDDGPDLADYAIHAVLGRPSAVSTFVDATQFKNPLTGRTIDVPAGYNRTATATMELRIYALPSLKPVSVLAAQGKASLALQPAAADAPAQLELMRQATAAAVRDKMGEMLDVVGAKGYVTDRRVSAKASIFRVTLNRKNGLRSGGSVSFWSLQKRGAAYEEVNIGKGVVSDIVSDEGAWIVVNDEALASKIRRGDLVKARHTGMFDELFRALRLPAASAPASAASQPAQ